LLPLECTELDNAAGMAVKAVGLLWSCPARKDFGFVPDVRFEFADEFHLFPW